MKKAILAPVPALLIGAAVMARNGLSPFIYMQNVVFYLVFGGLLLIPRGRPIRYRNLIMLWGLVMMGLTFFDSGLENVHRWLVIGGFRLYAASIVLPCIIICLTYTPVAFKAAVITIMLLMLAFQPDAAQLSAFAASSCYLLWSEKNTLVKHSLILLSGVLAAYSWLCLDTLEPVPHVEDILILAKDMGMLWAFLGVLSLGLLPFLGFPNPSLSVKAVGIYYLVVLASTFFGNFPVPIMGFGISPVMGYLLAVFLLFPKDAEY